jgi:hypothetical protein
MSPTAHEIENEYKNQRKEANGIRVQGNELVTSSLPTHWFDLRGLFYISTIVPFLPAYVDNRRLAPTRLIDTRIRSAFGISVRVSPEFPIEGRLQERGFGGSVGELDGVGQDTVLRCRKVSEGAACRDPEYDHVWRERLLNKEIRRVGVC